MQAKYRKSLIFRGLYISRINGQHKFHEKYFRDMMNGQNGILLYSVYYVVVPKKPPVQYSSYIILYEQDYDTYYYNAEILYIL